MSKPDDPHLMPLGRVSHEGQTGCGPHRFPSAGGLVTLEDGRHPHDPLFGMIRGPLFEEFLTIPRELNRDPLASMIGRHGAAIRRKLMFDRRQNAGAGRKT